MDVKYFPVIIEHGYNEAGEESFCAFFPDLPGCVSGGDGLDETLLNAGEALEMHLSAMIRDDEEIPRPSPLGSIEQDPEVEEVLRTLVRVDIPARLNLTVKET